MSKNAKIFLLIVWGILVCLEITKYFVYAGVYQDQRIWLYMSIHVCSFALYLLPILVFTNKDSKLHQIVFNFTLVTTFICAFSFAIGMDTPNFFTSKDTSAFYYFQSYAFHIVLTVLFGWFVIFYRVHMYAKHHKALAILIFLTNAYIFMFAQLFALMGDYAGQWILYNHEFEPIFSWCHQNEYLSNTVLFAFTLLVYEGTYFAYFYIEKAICKLSQKKRLAKHQSH